MKLNRRQFYGIPTKLALSFGLAVGTTLTLLFFGSSTVQLSYELLSNVLKGQVKRREKAL